MAERLSRGALSPVGARAVGSPELESLLRLRYPDFLRVAAAITGSSDAGRDAVQEAAARALARRDSFRGSGTLDAWLWSIVVNAARNIRARSPLVVEAFDGEAELIEGDETRRAVVRWAVAQLPEQQRLVLFLRYYADLDYQSIGTALGIRRGTVSATLHQAQQTLRGLLTEEGTR